MIEKEVTIKNRAGIHARPAALIVQTANEFDSEIYMEKSGNKINAKSIMGIMMLAAGKGDTIYIKVDGGDAHRALVELKELLLGDLDRKKSIL